MKLSEWIALARKSAGLTQAELAEKLDVTKANVSAWENDRHEPGWSKLLKVRELTGADLPIPGQAELSEDERLLLRLFRASPEGMHPVILAQIKPLADLTSEKVNSVTAEKSGTISHRAQDDRARRQSAIQPGTSSLDEAVREAESIFGGQGASSRTKTGKAGNGR